MSIVTKTGDDGSSSTLGQGRRSKSDAIFWTLGSLDELNSALGAASVEEDFGGRLADIQSQLLDLGSEIASLGRDERYLATLDGAVAVMEAEIDEWESELPPLTNFVLPGGTLAAAQLHVCRTMCRRAERELVDLRSSESTLRADGVKFLNRLSDWLFVAARQANHRRGHPDRIWRKT
jgi:cob(I)alamin adenosyltransferase